MPQEKIDKLKNTKVMHKLLLRMCSRSGLKHDLYQGWGVLDPWNILNSPNKLADLIDECTENVNNIAWRGKNLF